MGFEVVEPSFVSSCQLSSKSRRSSVSSTFKQKGSWCLRQKITKKLEKRRDWEIGAVFAALFSRISLVSFLPVLPWRLAWLLVPDCYLDGGWCLLAPFGVLFGLFLVVIWGCLWCSWSCFWWRKATFRHCLRLKSGAGERRHQPFQLGDRSNPSFWMTPLEGK